jgi:hypothetical protein
MPFFCINKNKLKLFIIGIKMPIGMPYGGKRLRFPLNRQNKYRARISFQPIQVESFINNESIANNSADGNLTSVGIQGGILAGLAVLMNRKKKVVQNGIKAFTKAGKIVAGTGAGVLVGANVASELLSDQSLLDRVVDGVNENKTNGDVEFLLRYRRLEDRCTLHVPVGLAFNDNVSIGNVNLNALGALGLGALNYDNESFVSSFFDAGQQYGADFLTALGAGTNSRVSSDAVRLTAQRLAQLAPGQNAGLQSAVTLGTQVVSNPNTRSVFQNVNVRTFSFAFKFIPLSREESREVEQIITFFRKFMYPEHIYFEIDADCRTQVPIGYKFPPLFDIKVGYDIQGRGTRYENLPNMEIHYCYLQSVQHNYNSSSMTFYEGGKPTEIDMSLTFVEYRTLSRYDIENEYNTAKDAQTTSSGGYLRA